MKLSLAWIVGGAVALVLFIWYRKTYYPTQQFRSGTGAYNPTPTQDIFGGATYT